MRAGNFILSEEFLNNSRKGHKNIDKLIILYELKSVILEAVEIYAFHLGNIREMHEDLHCVEEAIQEAFGFTPDRDYHRFWEWPYCKCPRLDNIDNWGSKFHYYSGDCPVHGDRGNHAEPITQENWKDKFFEAVEESVVHAKSVGDIIETERIGVRDHFAKNFVELIEHTQGHNMLYPITQYLLDNLPPQQVRDFYTKVVQALDEYDV